MNTRFTPVIGTLAGLAMLASAPAFAAGADETLDAIESVRIDVYLDTGTIEYKGNEVSDLTLDEYDPQKDEFHAIASEDGKLSGSASAVITMKKEWLEANGQSNPVICGLDFSGETKDGALDTRIAHTKNAPCEAIKNVFFEAE